VSIDRAATPFVLIAALPAAAAVLLGWPWIGASLLILPVAVALFFRDPDRTVPNDPDAILSPADGTVLHAGPARASEAPPGAWQQITIFLSLFDVHINRTPAAGRITRVTHVPGMFLPAFRPDAHRNEHSEIWIDRRGIMVVFRQVVGVLARRVVTRVKAGDTLEPGARIGLMKFGSRMDVFLPVDAVVVARTGEKVRAGETVIARLPTQDSR